MRNRVIMLTGSAPPEACGVGDYAEALVSSLQQLGQPVELLCWRRWNIAGVAALLRHLDQNRDALLHIQYPTFGYGYSLGPQIGSLVKRSVVTLHEFSLAHPLRKLSLLPFTFRTRRLLMTSEFERDSLLGVMPWAAERISIIPIGSNIPAARQPPIKQKPLRVLYHGLIMPHKGLEAFLALARLAQARGANWQFVVCGKIPESHMAYGRAMMQPPDRTGVQWLLDQNKDQVSALFGNGGVAYLPFVDGASERRGSLKAVLASGLPTVTTDSEQTTDDLRKAVVIANDTATAYNCICQLDASPAAQNALTEAALSYSKAFSWSTIAKEHIRVYDQLTL